MKLRLPKSIPCLALALLFALGLSPTVAFAATPAAQTITAEQASVIAEDAYVWAYPMLQNYQTMYRMIVVGDRKFNVIVHRRKLLDPSFTTIVGPNNDTLYSAVWLDLRRGPVRLTAPPIPDGRYWSVQFIDLMANNFAYIGSRATGSAGGTYAIAGPSSADDAVEGVDRVFRSESDFVFAIVRILTDDMQDALKVNALQDGFVLEAPPVGEAPAFPAYDAEKMRSHRFIEVVNFLLAHIEPHPDDLARLQRYRAIGIGAGVQAPQDPTLLAAIDAGVARAAQRIDARTKEIGRVVDGWSTITEGFGSREQIGDNLLGKAAAAKIGLYGNSVEENISWVAQRDASGATLDGGKARYTIRFERDKLPPARAFWSLTLYRMPEVLLYANEIDRYAIGDRTRGLHYDDDGSLTIYIQHERPVDDKLSNWLPAPEGPFTLALRMYLPDTAAGALDWHPPKLTVAPK